jgi:uncharacterized Zn-finger protein
MSETETYSRSTHGVGCPYCGECHDLTDLYEDLNSPEDATVTCPDCGKDYRVSFYRSISVTARRF